jgi:hypothetical protein
MPERSRCTSKELNTFNALVNLRHHELLAEQEFDDEFSLSEDDLSDNYMEDDLDLLIKATILYGKRLIGTTSESDCDFPMLLTWHRLSLTRSTMFSRSTTATARTWSFTYSVIALYLQHMIEEDDLDDFDGDISLSDDSEDELDVIMGTTIECLTQTAKDSVKPIDSDDEITL